MTIRTLIRRKVKGLAARFTYLKTTRLLAAQKFSSEDALLIISSPRSGSTWLTELLGNHPEVIINWEPFHPIHGPIPTAWRWGATPLLLQTDLTEKTRCTLDQLFTLGIHTPFSVQMIPGPERIQQARYVLTKSVRANLLLPIVRSVLSLRRPPIYLLRHPVAVGFSHLAIWKRTDNPANFELPDQINNERYKKELDYLRSLASNLELEVALWCIENAPVLDHPSPDWLVLHYESLRATPEKEMLRILHNFGFEKDHHFIEQLDFDLPSQTDYKKNLHDDAVAQISKWTKRVNPSEQKALQLILDRYGIKCYSAFSPFPLSAES